MFSNLQTISLEEIDQLSLMDRVDNKYLFHERHLNGIVKAITDDYQVLSIDSVTEHIYLNLYYDTPEFLCFNSHHRGLSGRFKVRFRSYPGSGQCYLEVKVKSNKGRTKKNRKKRQSIHHSLTKKDVSFIDTVLSDNISKELNPVLEIQFLRTTLASHKYQQRVTIDRQLSFLKYGDKPENKIEYHNLVIAEVKQGKSHLKSPMSQLLRDNKILSKSFSKYITGMISTRGNLQSNYFKPLMREMDKMLLNG